MRSPLGELGTRLASIINRAPVSYAPRGAGLGIFTPQRSDAEQQMRAYGSVGTLFAIVNRLANATSQVNWHLYKKSRTGNPDDRTEVTSHLALDIWNHPNDFYTRQEFVESVQQHVDLTGEGWWLIGRDPRATLPLELWPVRPDRMSVVPSPAEFLTGYIYRGPDGEQVPLGLTDVIQLRVPNPLDPYRGMGPVQAILVDLDTARFTKEWNRQFFLNSAEPGGIIEVDKRLSDDEFDEMTRRWREQHQGVTQSHRVAVLEQGKWVDRRYTNRDMQFSELQDQSKETIREAFGFPKPLLGTVEDVNRANAEAAEVVFARWLIVPRLERIKGALNNDFLPLFGSTAAGLEFDYESPVPEDQAAENAALTAKSTAAKTFIDAGFDRADVLAKLSLPAFDLSATPPPAPPGPPPQLAPAVARLDIHHHTGPVRSARADYNPAQRRDGHGRWSTGGAIVAKVLELADGIVEAGAHDDGVHLDLTNKAGGENSSGALDRRSAWALADLLDKASYRDENAPRVTNSVATFGPQVSAAGLSATGFAQVSAGGGKPITVELLDNGNQIELTAAEAERMSATLLHQGAASRVQADTGPVDVYLTDGGLFGLRTKGADGETFDMHFKQQDWAKLQAAVGVVWDGFDDSGRFGLDPGGDVKQLQVDTGAGVFVVSRAGKAGDPHTLTIRPAHSDAWEITWPADHRHPMFDAFQAVEQIGGDEMWDPKNLLPTAVAHGHRVPRPRNAADLPPSDLPDISHMADAYDAALAELLAKWADLTAAQKDALVAEVRRVAGHGSLDDLADLQVDSTDAAAALFAAMVALAAIAGQQMADEAAAQGVEVAAGTGSEADMNAVAAVTAGLLATELAVSAARAAMRANGPSATPDDIAAAVRTQLDSLSMANAETQLGAALHGSMNSARVETLLAAPEGAVYASEVLDKNTCKPCRAINGRWLGNISDMATIELSYPAGAYGGYIGCLGGPRCRGTIVGVWRSEQTK